MNTYRVTYFHGVKDVRKIVEADTVNGFKMGKKVVYVIPKSSVIDIEIVNEETSEI